MEALMTSVATRTKPACRAAVTWESRKIWDCFIDIFGHGGDRIARFRVNRRKGHPPTFTDTRGEGTGKGGTGIWGTMPELPGNRRCYYTPSAFRGEPVQLVGAERAEEIMQQVVQ
jgi:hypothetical protein